MKVILLTNKDFFGDNNQVKGIFEAINLKSKISEWQSIEESNFSIDLVTSDSLLIAAGSHAFDIIKLIKQHDLQLPIIWSGHQYFEKLNELQYWPNIIALPETSLNDIQKAYISSKAQLILTTGVAHCVNEQTIAADYKNFKGILPPNDTFQNHIGIIIAGDAPTAEGTLKVFSPDDAIEQAHKIAEFIKKSQFNDNPTAIMVTNGPRTGKHDPQTLKLHQLDPHDSNRVDASSAAFVDTLQSHFSSEQIFFYDFQFAALKEGPSAYKPIMKVVADSQQGLWFVPSESTSMVTESSFMAEKGIPVVIYHPASENEAHLAHAREYQKIGVVLDINSEDLNEGRQINKVQTAATQIAETIYNRYLLNDAKGYSKIRFSFSGEVSAAPCELDCDNNANFPGLFTKTQKTSS